LKKKEDYFDLKMYRRVEKQSDFGGHNRNNLICLISWHLLRIWHRWPTY